MFQRIFFIVLFLLFAVGGAVFAFFFLFSPTNPEEKTPMWTQNITPYFWKSQTPTSTSILTGLSRENNTEEKILGFMIDESLAARPLHRGLEQASIFFEIPAEGGIPRLLAIFSSDSLPEEIGPIRSARDYFVKIAEPFVGAYVHAGGSPMAFELLAKTNMYDVDEGGDDVRFLREKDIDRPHNLFAIAEEIVDETSAPKISEVLFLRSKKPIKNATIAEEINVSFSTEHHSVRWKYNEKDVCYERIQRHEITTLCLNNVVLLQAEMWNIEGDEKLRIGVQTTGEGDAFIFRNGQMHSGIWRRTNDGVFSFEDDFGEEIPLAEGTVFVQIVASKEHISITEKE